MKRAIQKHIWRLRRDRRAGAHLAARRGVRALAPALLPAVVGAGVGSDFVDYNAEFSTAQAVVAGQGQTIQVAGVSIGEIGKVTLKDGKAVVQMKIRKKYTPIYRDATALLRPKTGLNDMVVALDPGNSSAGAIPEEGTLPVSQTQPAVQLDEFLAGFDADTRDYLQLLVGGGRRGPPRQRRGARRDAEALRSDGALPEADQPPARQARQGDRALDPQLQGAERGARRQGRAARRASSTPRTRSSRTSRASRTASRRRCACCPTRSSRPTTRSRSPASCRRPRPDADRADADRRGPRARAEGLPELREGDDADVQGPAAPVRAGRRVRRPRR